MTDTTGILTAQVVGIIPAKSLTTTEQKLCWFGFTRAEDGGVVRFDETVLVLGDVAVTSTHSATALVPVTRIKFVERSVVRPTGVLGDATPLVMSRFSSRDTQQQPVLYLEQETLQPKLRTRPTLPVRVIRVERVMVTGPQPVDLFRKQLGYHVESQMQRNARVWLAGDRIVEIFQMCAVDKNEGRLWYVKNQAATVDPWVVVFHVPLRDYNHTQVEAIATWCGKFRPEIEFCRFPDPGNEAE